MSVAEMLKGLEMIQEGFRDIGKAKQHKDKILLEKFIEDNKKEMNALKELGKNIRNDKNLKNAMDRTLLNIQGAKDRAAISAAPAMKTAKLKERQYDAALKLADDIEGSDFGLTATGKAIAQSARAGEISPSVIEKSMDPEKISKGLQVEQIKSAQSIPWFGNKGKTEQELTKQAINDPSEFQKFVGSLADYAKSNPGYQPVVNKMFGVYKTAMEAQAEFESNKKKNNIGKTITHKNSAEGIKYIAKVEEFLNQKGIKVKLKPSDETYQKQSGDASPSEILSAITEWHDKDPIQNKIPNLYNELARYIKSYGLELKSPYFTTGEATANINANNIVNGIMLNGGYGISNLNFELTPSAAVTLDKNAMNGMLGEGESDKKSLNMDVPMQYDDQGIEEVDVVTEEPEEEGLSVTGSVRQLGE